MKDKQEEYFMRKNRKDFRFMLDHNVAKKKDRQTGGISVSQSRDDQWYSDNDDDDECRMWEHVQSYKRAGKLIEKLVLMDRKVAAEIADKIEATSERGPDTLLVDGDGGFHRITEELVEKRKAFNKCNMFCRDHNLRPLTERAMASYLLSRDTYTLTDSNLNTYPALNLDKRGHHVSKLHDLSLDLPYQDWRDPFPNYTLFATVTYSFIKFLLARMTFKYNLDTFSFNEFAGGRPEFYFIVTPRTWSLMSNPARKERSNIMCHLLFDIELLSLLDPRAFAPWKTFEYSYSAAKSLGDKLCLIKMRPKLDHGIETPGVPVHHLACFVRQLYKTSRSRLIPMLDGWNSNAALEAVKEGVSVYATPNALEIGQVIHLFNILARQPDYHSCNFGIFAKEFSLVEMGEFDGQSSRAEATGKGGRGNNDDAVRQRVLEMKRKLKMDVDD